MKPLQKFQYLDYWLVIPYLLLSIVGIIMVYSASANIAVQNGGSPTAYLYKQSLYVGLGIIVALWFMFMKLGVLRAKLTLETLTVIMVVMLIYVKLFGKAVNGAKGWINFGFINIQPAEIAKLVLIIYVAHVLANHEERIGLGDLKSGLKGPIVVSILIVGLILIQPDLGGAVINAAIVFVMILASGISYKWATGLLFGAGGGFMALLMVLANHFAHVTTVSHYQFARIVAFVNPFGTAKGVGSQLVNSYYALSNGGVFGVGLGNSIQKTGYLPEPNTDFILAVIGEELGLITVIGLLLLITMIVVRTILIGIHANQAYESLICYGYATFMTVETFFNVGGVIGLLPITGVTFPFISYGGSSILVLSAGLGIVLNISCRVKRERGKQSAVTSL